MSLFGSFDSSVCSPGSSLHHSSRCSASSDLSVHCILLVPRFSVLLTFEIEIPPKMPEAMLSVQGMTCSACTASVSEALEHVPQVHRASVSFLTNEAKVQFSAPLDPKLLVDAVEDCGFYARLVSCSSPNNPEQLYTTTIVISGMTCSACSSTITETLQNIEGVLSCSVSLLTDEAIIIHKVQVSAPSLVSAVEDCGFDATVKASEAVSCLEKSMFRITGMTCGACSASITSQLMALSDVISVDISQMTYEAIVTHTSSITVNAIKTAIEDCGFVATVLPSSALATKNSYVEDVTLQIYGLSEVTDFSVYQYNVEAVLNSFPGVLSFQFELHTLEEDHSSANLSFHDQNLESLIDVLRVRLNCNVTGIRALVDALDAIDEQLSYKIFNCIDQSLSSQLKVLSKANEIRYWRKTFFISLALGIPTILLNAIQNLEFWRKSMIFDGLFLVTLLQLALASFVLFELGAPFFKKFKFFLLNKGQGANMDVLVCVSSTITYTFSLISMALSVWAGKSDKPPKVCFDTIVMLFCFVSLGKWIENKAKGATSFALSRLLSLTPTTCLIVLTEGENDIKTNTSISLYPTKEISIDLIQNNDIVMVIPGSKMPVDGVVIEGHTEIDESVVTGESMPMHKEPGSRVIGGSINGPSVVYVKVMGAGKNSQLHQIINIVKNSQVNRAPVQRLADYVAARFVFFILALSLVTLTFWLIFAKYFSGALPAIFHKDANGKYYVCFKLAISVIVVACPCALGLAAPTAVMVGTGVGASYGALIKGGDVLEKANDVNVILFDKTGTLTSGEMELSNYRRLESSLNLSASTWWNLVGSLEANSEHPTAKAIVRAAREKLCMTFEEDTFESIVTDLKIIPGMGLSAQISSEDNTRAVAVGNIKFVVKKYPEARALLAKVLENELADSVSSVCHVVVDGQYSGYMELNDSLKPCARDVVHYLQHIAHYQVGIITGDSSKVALQVGHQLGIPEGNVFGDVLPVEKDQIVESIRERFGGKNNISIAFVGDGINDAPALVGADLGMAISSGTDIAVDSAEVVLLGSEGGKNDLVGIITALEVSGATFSKIKWNFFFACIYNVFMLPFAMGCFLPFDLMLSPVAAAGAMACSSISVVLNSLLLKNWKPPQIKPSLDYSVEEIEIETFSLKHLTIDQFNYVKRRNLPLKLRWLRSRGGLKRPKEAHGYELLDSN